MNVDRFNVVVEHFTERENALLGTKRADYARGDQDCLINFKEVPIIMGTTPQLYCLTLLMKHIHSIIQAAKKGIEPPEWVWASPQGEGLKQHVADARNFLVLFAALVEEDVIGKTIVTEDEEP